MIPEKTSIDDCSERSSQYLDFAFIRVRIRRKSTGANIKEDQSINVAVPLLILYIYLSKFFLNRRILFAAYDREQNADVELDFGESLDGIYSLFRSITVNTDP